jgi:hypothetical protein
LEVGSIFVCEICCARPGNVVICGARFCFACFSDRMPPADAGSEEPPEVDLSVRLSLFLSSMR